MAALTADKVVKSKGPLRRQRYKVAASTVLYAGGLVCLSGGYAVPASDTAALSNCVGVATAKADNGSGAAGDIDVIVEYGGAFLIDKAAAITQADVGADAVAADDQTVTDAAAGVNDIIVGRILEIVGTQCWVNIDNT